MKVVLQRVSSAKVEVEGALVGQISGGVLLLLGVAPDDDESKVDWLIKKILALRIFPDPKNKNSGSALQLCLEEVAGEALVVSQFTLFADLAKGRRPSFSGAAQPQVAEYLYDYFVRRLSSRVNVQRGKFGADMQVSSTNDGPMTLLLER
jgi:D-tyrosyl-tRNA(Tyr) deacylase